MTETYMRCRFCRRIEPIECYDVLGADLGNVFCIHCHEEQPVAGLIEQETEIMNDFDQECIALRDMAHDLRGRLTAMRDHKRFSEPREGQQMSRMGAYLEHAIGGALEAELCIQDARRAFLGELDKPANGDV